MPITNKLQTQEATFIFLPFFFSFFRFFLISLFFPLLAIFINILNNHFASFIFFNCFVSVCMMQAINGVQFRCDYCKCDLTNKKRIKCCTCKNFDLCLDCFYSGVELFPHEQDHPYQIIVSFFVSLFAIHNFLFPLRTKT